LAITDLFYRRHAQKSASTADSPINFPTKALPKLLAALRLHAHPKLLDLGPATEKNVTFFGEQIQCKIFIEDLFIDIDQHVIQGKTLALENFFISRFPQSNDSVDCVLAWDLFDYLEQPAKEALATQLMRIISPSGFLLTFFSGSQADDLVYTRRIILDESTLQNREYPGVCNKKAPMLNRDIIKLFNQLQVVEQLLLRTSVREILFQKQ
jgi:hypothetical protein